MTQRVYAIIGSDVSRSRSPRMHNAAFRAMGIDAVYVPFDVDSNELERAVGALRTLRFGGFNVTVPHKEAILPFLDEIEPEAVAVGAVNTVIEQDAKLIGCNTDVFGVIEALRERAIAIASTKCVVLGAGGAARAAIAGLALEGASHITVVARRLDQARELTRIPSDLCRAATIDVCSFDRAELARAFSDTSIIVQATTSPTKEFARNLPFENARNAVLMDLVYIPLETEVMKEATRHAIATVDGLGMLLHQGVRAFERWTSQDAPVDVMREALRASFG